MITIWSVYRYWFIGIYYSETKPYELSNDNDDSNALNQIEIEMDV